ncbi:hypothetical protein, variant 7 [Phytophthora nicotianae]|uniref:Uncharacterized protein n=1 Tax=Phytophthora nicotianae TaxID=4792 RepID=W2JGF8_PHYNI|nr:hypothetical protein, variant 4 [Phytophthora nicotianae]ETL45517.1 hypothetical protein, variant 5 [Phytophthora nicotianae]ETL45518.1 hypothetical protein, variant 6 [Phytophthora nicotianae]ETL45519.1 hypothetical protein, variant 7 [Phytophthora nicotianae]
MPGTRTAARHASRNSYRPSLRSVVKITVEIDQTSLAKKRMYNRGCCCQECWLFGGIERRTGFTVGRIVYDKRTKQTVLPLSLRLSNLGLKTCLTPSQSTFWNEATSSILSKQSPSLSMQYTHSWMNHSLNFVDYVTGHIQYHRGGRGRAVSSAT